jgi:hypothetical protein
MTILKVPLKRIAVEARNETTPQRVLLEKEA